MLEKAHSATRSAAALGNRAAGSFAIARRQIATSSSGASTGNARSEAATLASASKAVAPAWGGAPVTISNAIAPSR